MLNPVVRGVYRISHSFEQEKRGIGFVLEAEFGHFVMFRLFRGCIQYDQRNTLKM